MLEYSFEHKLKIDGNPQQVHPQPRWLYLRNDNSHADRLSIPPLSRSTAHTASTLITYRHRTAY